MNAFWRRPRRAKLRCRGFTLLEVAIGLAVLAILAAIALPNFGAGLQRQRAQSAAEGLVADLSDARFEAARRGLPMFVNSQAGNPWCWAVATAADCACGQPQPAACVLRQVKAADHQGVRLLAPQNVRLQPDGAAQAVQVAVVESARGDRLLVELSAMGRARLCSEKGNFSRVVPC